MGLFTRKEATSSRRQAQRPRPSVSSEAQAASMRVKARRRLAGAVALVLAAVIVLPMLLDGEPRPVPTGIQIDVPKKTDPFNPDLSANQTDSGTSTSATAPKTDSGAAAQGAEVARPQPLVGQAGGSVGVAGGADSPSQAPKQPAQGTSTAASDTALKPQEKKAATPDNTSVAMAILEGRKPAASTAPSAKPATGGLLVQIASYSTQADADARRDKLASQGITNAFVEAASVNGKSTFRLRVGPFESRDAAQAAQTRLRTLGYGDGMILSK